jgi:transketolase
MSDIAQLAINTIRTLSMDAVQRANSGHPGAPMGLAAAAYTLWTRHLRHNPRDPEWFNRDRFVLSNGHASMLLYSLLHLTGYEQMTLEQIKNFRQWGSVTPGHPENHITDGVEMTTGPLGQGISTAVGMALAEAQLNDRFDGLVDHYTFGICSDGDLMEGVSAEASSLAGHLGLGKLIFLYDDNNITIDGRTDITFTEDVLGRYEAYGWHVDVVEDANDVEAVDHAIAQAREVTDKPSLISIPSIIGFGSPNKADSSSSHGAPLGEDEVKRAKEQLGWEFEEPFHVPPAVVEHMDATARGTELQSQWETKLAKYESEEPEKYAELTRRMRGELPDGWADDLPSFDPDDRGMATRKSGGAVIQKIYAELPELTGGSADLAGSNKTLHEEYGVMAPGNFDAQNIHFGVREHGMAAITNGMTLHGGVRGFGATFLVFADYMRPALRIAALSHVPSLMVFTHDSIGLGEDGPTHQPIAHLASLRAMPNYWVFRPGDANEVPECWKQAIERTDGPSCLVLTRQNVPTIDRSKYDQIGDPSRGGYVIADAPSGSPDVILMATGSEVNVCLDAWQLLVDGGREPRVVSMPCWELFEAQGDDWIEEVLPARVTARVAVEAASPFGWSRWVGPLGATIAMDRFGASAPGDVAFEKFGFTPENVARHALDLLEG